MKVETSDTHTHTQTSWYYYICEVTSLTCVILFLNDAPRPEPNLDLNLSNQKAIFLLF